MIWNGVSRRLGLMAAVLGIGFLGSSSRAKADVVFATGNQQYTNVNFVADVDALTITGHVGQVSDNIHVFFEGFGAGPSFTQLLLHASHGAASVSPSLSTDQMFKMTLTADPGLGFDAMDWKLDGEPPVDGTVTFMAYDAMGNLINHTGSDTFNFDHNGQNPFNVATTGGSIIHQLVITSTIPIADIKQVSVRSVPEPGTLAMVSLGGLVLVGARRRNRKRKQA